MTLDKPSTRLLRPVRAVLAALADLLSPPCCPFCGGEGEPSLPCPACREELAPASPALGLSRTGLPAGERQYFQAALAPFHYAPPLSEQVQRFKYGRLIYLALPFGRLMAEYLASNPDDLAFDCIVPVPLHDSRLRWRGFNQAVLLGRELARRLGGAGEDIPDAYEKPAGRPEPPLHTDLLRRTRPTQVQVGLAPEARRANVRGAFSVVDPKGKLQGRRVLLVDDVFTTGCTTNECARALIRGGAEEVRVFCLAAVDPAAGHRGDVVAAPSDDRW